MGINSGIFWKISRLFSAVFFVAFLSFDANADQYEFAGVSDGSMVIIRNYAPNSDMSCVEKIYLNGSLLKIDLSRSFASIELSDYGIMNGDEFRLNVIYNGNCQPQVENSRRFMEMPKFDLLSSKIEEEGGRSTLILKIRQNFVMRPYYVEQFRNGKWVKVGAIMAQRRRGEVEYTLSFASLAGENTMRVYQVNDKGVRLEEKVFTVKSPKTEPVVVKSIKQKSTISEIEFSGYTEYFVIDGVTGDVKMQGMAKKVDISSLPKGKYFLEYENSCIFFKRKK
ncbi:MAG: hypothetical protein HUK15_08010 [Bacteroidales bacterium]|nr:hypothetical protein [Bacteroidales bacterium]